MKIKTLLLTLIAICSLQTVFGQNEEPLPPPPPDEMPLRYVDEQAMFPGGKEAMFKYLAENLRYPESVSKDIYGKVYLQFIVHKDGSISDIIVQKGVPGCKECDKEAIRVVKGMPDWIPAKNNGKIVDSYFTLPITFNLQ